MANKVLVGVGIGCGVLVLLGVIVGGVGFFWAKKTFGGAVEAGQQMAAQENDLKALEKSYPFTPPAEGELLVLQESRLNDYFAVREAALPLFKDFEKKAEGFQQEGETANITEGLQASAMVAQLISQTRGVYIESLKKHRMSPREFHTITGTIYASAIGDSMGQVNQGLAEQRAQSAQALEELRAKLADSNLSEEERSTLEQEQTMLQDQLDALAEAENTADVRLDKKAQGVASANVTLLKKFDERIKNAYNPAFDALIAPQDLQGLPGMGGVGGSRTQSE
jgi:hypothetical protein